MQTRFQTSKKKMAALFLGSLLFVAAGSLMLSFDPLAGYACVALFGLCAVVGGVGLLPGSSYLELGDDGFTVCTLFRKNFVRWSHIQDFKAVQVELQSMVGWIFEPQYKPESRAGKLSK